MALQMYVYVYDMFRCTVAAYKRPGKADTTGA